MPRVSQRKIDRQLDRMVDLIGAHPAGLTLSALAEALHREHDLELRARTIRRRVEQLVLQRRIAPANSGSKTTYQVPEYHADSTALEAQYVPLTANGLRVRGLVRKPIIERAPVGYDADWLSAYEPGKTWYLPKAIRSRLHQLGRTPDERRPAGTFAREILSRLLIDLAWASSRLEGNTYTRLDTQNLLEFGQRAEGKDAQETQMILNHKVAIEYLVDEAEHIAFSRASLLAVHAALSENLIGDPADEGRLRTRPVNITGTTYTPNGVPQVIEECFDRILRTVEAIPDPFEQSFFAMVHIPYLQPFVDINKRTSRLAANIPLIRENLCPLSFVDVPERAYVEGILGIYEQRRIELLRDVFVWAYERSCAQYRVIRDSLAQPDPMRLRHRSKLNEVVAKTVRAGDPPQKERLRGWAETNGVPEADVDAFTELALSLLLNLNEGSAARYQLRPSEFQAWKARFRRA